MKLRDTNNNGVERMRVSICRPEMSKGNVEENDFSNRILIASHDTPQPQLVQYSAKRILAAVHQVHRLMPRASSA